MMQLQYRLVSLVLPRQALPTLDRKLEPRRLTTHHFKLENIVSAYETFSHAADSDALKVIVEVS